MKKIFLLGLVALGMLATGCSNEDEVNPIDPAGKVEGYMSLALVGNTTRTSVGNEGTQDTEGNENLISNVTVVLTDAAGLITHVQSPAISNNVAEKFEVAVGNHFVYALVNCPLSAAELTGNIERVIDVATAADAANGFKDGSFFMVNQRNASTEQAGIAVTITAANTASNPAKATVYVDRVAVKIVDTKDYATNAPDVTALAGVTNQGIDAVDVIGFVTLNVNKQFNLIQKWDATDEVLSTPLYTGTHVKDQYFNHVGEYTEIVKDANDSILTITNISNAADFNRNTKYVTENRPTIKYYGDANDKMTSGRGETTGVIYSVQAKKDGANLGTFYAYRDVMYTSLTAIEALADFKDVTLPSEVNKLRALGIKVYEDGIMYYTHFIKGTNNLHQLDGANYYGVFRNSVYSLGITKFSSLGDDTPGGTSVDPNEPGEGGNPNIDSDKAYIEVTVTPNPWVLNTINVEF